MSTQPTLGWPQRVSRPVATRKTDVRESEIEKKMGEAVRAAGGLSLKWVSPGFIGVPDRIVMLPGARLVFVEVKAPGEKPKPHQLRVHEKLRNLGFKVSVVDSVTKIDDILC